MKRPMLFFSYELTLRNDFGKFRIKTSINTGSAKQPAITGTVELKFNER